MSGQKESDSGSQSTNSVRPENSGSYYSGRESFFGVFTQTQVFLSGVRLVHEGKVTQQVSDLASQVETNRRNFLHSGDVNFALQELTRITNAFNQRIQSWESEANRRENNRKTMNGGQLAKMKAELSMVRTKVRLAQRTLTKLEIELHKISGEESSAAAKKRKQIVGATTEKPEQFPLTDPDQPAKPQPPPALSMEDQARISDCVVAVRQVLKQVVGDSLLVSADKADLPIEGDADRMEQVWDSATGSQLPVLLAAGWRVKHPSESTGIGRARKKLDLCFWLIPKSLQSSTALQLVDGQTELWISSRKLDSARIKFGIAAESERPESDLLSRFLADFRKKYATEPTLLVAHFDNLEWTQKTVLVSHVNHQE